LLYLTAIAASFGLGALWQSQRQEDRRIQFEKCLMGRRGGPCQFGDSRGLPRRF
jgi:hypothetical protein